MIPKTSDLIYIQTNATDLRLIKYSSNFLDPLIASIEKTEQKNH